jgi:hypothetical protein
MLQSPSAEVIPTLWAELPDICPNSIPSVKVILPFAIILPLIAVAPPSPNKSRLSAKTSIPLVVWLKEYGKVFR